MNLFEIEFDVPKANPNNLNEMMAKYNQLTERYKRLANDCKNLQETCRYQDGKIHELRECLNAVLDDSLVTGMKSWKDKTFKALEEAK